MSTFYRYSAAAALLSGAAAIAAAADGPAESLCAAPGITVATDAAGDEDLIGAPAGLTQGIPPDSGADLLSLQVAQAPGGDGIPRIVFTLKTSGLSAPDPLPFTSWFASFKGPDKQVRAVRMLTDQTGTPVFQSYIVEAPTVGGTDPNGDFAVSGSEKPAEAESNFSSDGTITIVVRAPDIAVKKPGDALKGFVGGVTQLLGNSTTGQLSSSEDSMPDGFVRAGEIVTVDNGCAGGGKSLAQAFGGALGFGLLLPLLGLLGLRRRTSRTSGT